MARQFSTIEVIPQPKATEALRSIARLPARVRATDRDGVVMAAARAAERDGTARFVAPVARWGVACWEICKSLQAAVDTALMHHTRAKVYEIAADRSVVAHAIEVA